MRKIQQQEILNCLGNLKKAHEEIKAALYREEYSSVQNMLSECQDFAISIGENIESTEGEGNEAVLEVEAYCELLFHIFEDINNGTTNEYKVEKSLRKQLVKIENSVRNNISIQKEIIFLPYKASMWDSLESIWKKASENPECVTYVIPIPYYEKNPDGSLREMHCEKDLFPDYVPITDWKQYDITARRPDEIYIHNPYDQYNYVTTVHPDFYSSKLRQYTDMLVYCPYFVAVSDKVEEHFCTAPGVLFADKVIVESEEVKKRYISALRNYEKENNCTGTFGNWNKKIEVSKYGSPKVEKLKNTIRESIEVPEKWQKLIRSDSAKPKKVILYNTTVDASLKNQETYIKKIEDVLAAFKKQQNFVLLWRPHPLLLPTLRAMRPNLYAKLRDIMKIYKEEAWGIFDETPDIDRAIVLSDAYYGDWSSVVEMYKATGKPILISDYQVYF